MFDMIAGSTIPSHPLQDFPQIDIPTPPHTMHIHVRGPQIRAHIVRTLPQATTTAHIPSGADSNQLVNQINRHEILHPAGGHVP